MKKIVLYIAIDVFLIFQSLAYAANTIECAQGGRYQFYDGAVPRVFDTQIGKIYVWFPHNEKAGENPYLFVQDPINGKGVRITIDFTEEPAAKK